MTGEKEETKMGGLNIAIVMGRLGRDPELRYTAGGTSVCKFSVAVDSVYKGEKQTDWFNIVCFGKTADNCGQYLQKGREVLIDGSIKIRSYEDKDGNKKYITEILANRVQFLGSNGSKRSESKPEESKADQGESKADYDDEDLPF